MRKWKIIVGQGADAGAALHVTPPRLAFEADCEQSCGNIGAHTDNSDADPKAKRVFSRHRHLADKF